MNQSETALTPTRLVRSVFGMFLFRIGGQIITFILIAMLARYLGPDSFGIYSTLTIFIGFCAILLAPGLNDLLIRDTWRIPSDRPALDSSRLEVIRSGYGLRLGLALFGFAAAVTIGPALRWEGVTTILIVFAGISLFTSITTPSYRFVYDVPLQLDYRMDRAAGLNLLGRIILLAAIFIAVYFDLGLFGIVFLQAIGETSALIVLIILLFRNGHPVKPRFDPKTLGVLLLPAIPIITSEALTITYTRLDILFLNQFASAREAGIFAGPVRIIDGLQIIPTVFLGALIPLFNKLKQADSAAFDRVFRLSSRALWACGIVCATAIYPFSDALTQLIFGAEFGDSALILKYGVYCAPLVFVGTLIPAMLIVQSFEKYIGWIYLSLVMVNIGLNLILIPEWGAVGAIISKISTYAIVFPIAMLFPASRHEALTILSLGFLPLLLSLAGVYYIDKLNLPLLWGLPIVTALAASAFWFSGWFGKQNLRELINHFTGRYPTENR